MITPTKAQITGGMATGRKFIANASSWGNSMVTDAELQALVTAVLNGALNVPPAAAPKPPAA